MPLTRQQKEQRVAEMKDVLGSAALVVVMSFDALTVADVTDLRERLAETDSFMRVVPKRLLRLAIQGSKVDFDPLQHKEQLAVVWGSDASAPAKAVYNFAKEHETVQLLTGLVEGRTLSADEVIALAQLPSRQELLAQLVGVLAGPLRSFVSVLSGIPRSFVQALQAVADQKQAAAN